MKWKNRLTNYNFWISLISAILLIFQAFNFELNIAYVSEIATAVLGLLVVIGIISDPTKIAVDSPSKKEEPKKEKISEQPSTENEIENLEENNCEVKEDYVTPNISANENSVCGYEGDIQTIITHITKEIEKATEKLKTENIKINNEISEITSKVEEAKQIEETELHSEESNLQAQIPQIENIQQETSSVYNIVNQ